MTNILQNSANVLRRQNIRLSLAQASMDVGIHEISQELGNVKNLAYYALGARFLRFLSAGALKNSAKALELIPSFSNLNRAPFMVGVFALLAQGCVREGAASYSEIHFNPLIMGDLSPSKTRRVGTHFMNAQSAGEAKSDLYPDSYSDLAKIRTAKSLWVSSQFFSSHRWNLSWELVVSGLNFGQKTHNLDRFRTCVPFTDPETGLKLEVDSSSAIVSPIFNFSDFTVMLSQCEIPKAQDSRVDCQNYDLRKELMIPESAMLIGKEPPTLRSLGCFLDASLPPGLLKENSDLTLRVALRDTSLEESAQPRRIFPQVRVLHGCQEILRPLTYDEKMSGVALVDPGNGKLTPAQRLRWCWGVDQNPSEDGLLSEFFLPELLVKGVSTCLKKTEDSECQAAKGEYLNVLVRDCAPENDLAASYDLEHCVDGGKYSVTPSHVPDDPAHPLSWCLENRSFPNVDGSYPPARWKKDDLLFIRFNICE